ncbi:hypothetical protein [Clostridium estertheticum]|uniref:hypothetical protein n=1 Tax=Clostridium estertheticum TaxID=238834 RepID=UPI001C7CB97A|nr:hypothetical protein [Clostridium estertheticum]MBX4266591.1 hypothetical protein [Clostridium estertheticum]WLC88071.1 hypothetical protein KTC95_18940 [Clostridium estertheticum]
MLSEKIFNEMEMNYGCGYWGMCSEHSCPCAIVTENKGLQESIYNGFVKENRKLTEEYERGY